MSEVTLGGSFIVAATGMVIVMMALAALYFLVIGMAKVVGRMDEVIKTYNAGKNITTQKNNKVENTVKKQEEKTTENLDDELAIIMVAVAEESGLSTEEFIIKSVRPL